MFLAEHIETTVFKSGFVTKDHYGVLVSIRATTALALLDHRGTYYSYASFRPRNHGVDMLRENAFGKSAPLKRQAVGLLICSQSFRFFFLLLDANCL